MNQPVDRLYKDPEHGVWAGVFAGLSEYLEVDPALLRIIYVLITLGSGILFGLITYFIVALCLPDKATLQ